MSSITTLPALLVVSIPGVPESDLSPNARVHPLKRARIVKAARGDAKNATLYVLGGMPFVDCVDRYRLDVTIRWPGRRKIMDPQNLIATLKACVDGIADGICVNDSRFDVGTITQLRDKDGPGETRIEIRESEAV